MDDATKDLYWVLFFLVMLGVVWYSTGGPTRQAATSGPFLENPQEKHTEEITKKTEQITSGKSGEELPITQKEPTTESAYRYEATLKVGYKAKEKDPQKEYIEIKASSQNNTPLRITNWSLEGKEGLDIEIGKGTYLFFSGQPSSEQDIFLSPGAKAIIATGQSPIGTSFRINKCTGYFEQFQDFAPSLPKNCPYPEDEVLPLKFKDPCLDYIEKLPRCEIQVSPPMTLSTQCKEYVTSKINYKTCVDLHKHDSDFYKDEWRIYLGREQELWKEKRETIILRDENDKIIDWKSY